MRTILAAIVALSVPLVTHAQDAEIGVYYQKLSQKNGETSHRVFSEGYVYLNEKSGVWGFVYGEKEYFSAVAGFFHDLFSFGNDAIFEIGVGAGAERFPDEDGVSRLYSRLAGNVFVGNEKLFSEWYFETGPSKESWFRVNTLWQAKKFVGVGLFHQTGDGVGPRAVFSLPRTSVRIWVAPMFGGDGRRLLLGGELVFQKGCN